MTAPLKLWMPAGLARPAQRALQGFDSLEAVASRSRAEVAALHGMGPNALRTLDAALAGRGLAFRAP